MMPAIFINFFFKKTSMRNAICVKKIQIMLFKNAIFHKEMNKIFVYRNIIFDEEMMNFLNIHHGNVIFNDIFSRYSLYIEATKF